MTEPNATEFSTPGEQDFPASAPSPLKKIPRSVIIVSVIIAALVLMVITFPRKTKARQTLTSLAESEKIDNYEQSNPIKTDPFSTEYVENSTNAASPIDKSSSLNENTYSAYSGTTSSPTVERGQLQQSNQNYLTAENNSPSIAHSSSASTGYTVSAEVSSRLNESYQAMVNHFKNVQAVVAVSGDAYKELLKGDKFDRVEPSLKNLTENSEHLANKVAFSVPSGTRIRAVTMQEVNSDHPGYFTARITFPMELSGYTLLCQSKGNARDRIPVTANKIVSPDGSKEAQIPGEVQMQYAGLEGSVKSHLGKRLVPPILSALTGAGAGYLYFKAFGGDQLNDETGRINTADGVVGPAYQQGVSGVQNEIGRFGGDYPNTVIVPHGVQFELLVTEPFSIEL
ncbi:MAG: TrbI/VirB10 family protein [Spirochaetes bacterium]|nr:TrbI/VirB10 family protein [Spirochaetota bacterium]